MAATRSSRHGPDFSLAAFTSLRPNAWDLTMVSLHPQPAASLAAAPCLTCKATPGRRLGLLPSGQSCAPSWDSRTRLLDQGRTGSSLTWGHRQGASSDAITYLGRV